METSSTSILKSIPDFEDFKTLSTEIAGLLGAKMALEAKIRAGESDVFKEATSNEKYFQNGKPPTISYIENTYKYKGLEGELVGLRSQLIEVISKLEEKKLLLDVYKSMIDVWRTLSSNERASAA